MSPRPQRRASIFGPRRPGTAPILVLFLFVGAAPCVAQEPGGSADPARFLALERTLMEAVAARDVDVVESLLHDDFRLVSSESSGPVTPKAQYLRGIAAPQVLTVESFEFRDLDVRALSEDVVVVTTRLDWRSVYHGLRWDADFLMTDTWVEEGGSWRLVHRHSSYPREQVRVMGREVPWTASSESPSEACDGARFRDFDYWIGTWKVYNHEDTWIGTNTIAPAAEACVLVEQWQPRMGGPTGMSLNHFDRGRDRWEQLWVGGGGLVLRLAGGLDEEGVMELTATEPRQTPRGEILDRIRWIPRPDGSVVQHWEVSTDGGTEWNTTFQGIYRRAAGTPASGRRPR